MAHTVPTKGLENSLNQVAEFNARQVIPVCLSRVCVNWLMLGGTLRRWYSTCRCRWSLMYLGQRTKRVRSFLGRMLPPGRQDHSNGPHNL